MVQTRGRHGADAGQTGADTGQTRGRRGADRGRHRADAGQTRGRHDGALSLAIMSRILMHNAEELAQQPWMDSMLAPIWSEDQVNAALAGQGKKWCLQSPPTQGSSIDRLLGSLLRLVDFRSILVFGIWHSPLHSQPFTTPAFGYVHVGCLGVPVICIILCLGGPAGTMCRCANLQIHLHHDQNGRDRTLQLHSTMFHISDTYSYES